MVNQNTFRACKIKLIRISSNDWSKQMSCRDRTSLILFTLAQHFLIHVIREISIFFLKAIKNIFIV